MTAKAQERLFQVVFEGVLTDEFSPEDTKHRFGRLFNLKGAKLEKLFSGRTFIIKKNIVEEEAMQYAIKIAEAGCECYIETMPEAGKAQVQEKRHDSERRIRFRRGPRPGAIVPDRRMSIRREADSDMFEELHLKNLRYRWDLALIQRSNHLLYARERLGISF